MERWCGLGGGVGAGRGEGALEFSEKGIGGLTWVDVRHGRVAGGLGMERWCGVVCQSCVWVDLVY